MQSSPIDYGKYPPRRITRNALKLLAIVALCVSGCIVAAYFAYQWFYYEDLRAVRRELSKHPDIVINQIDGMDDIALEHIWADVTVTTGARTNVRFRNLDDAMRSPTPRVLIEKIGPYRFSISSYGYQGAVRAADNMPVKSEGFGQWVDFCELSNRFPFPVATTKDVIDHADEIVAIIAQWPSKIEFQNAKGMKYKLYIIGGNHLSSQPSWDEMRFPEAQR